MAFFLLGRSADDELTLLSAHAFDSQQDALAELGRITADPAFNRWDDDVLLLDLAGGTPVLLVRPTSSAGEPRGEQAVVPEVPLVELAVEPEAELEAEVEPEVEPEGEPDGEPEGEPEPVAESVAEGEPEPADATTTLRAALTRTTEHMEASGISAPESIGPSDAEPVADLDAEAQGGTEAEAEVAEPAASVEEPAVPVPAAPAWPWDTPAPDAAASEVEYVISPLDEPAIDAGGSLIMSSADDEMVAAARPVILGAYEESPEAAEPEAAEPEAAETTESAPSSEEDGDGAEPVPEEPHSEGEAVAAGGGSDFIVLESPSADETVAVPEAGAEVSPLSAYTCDDCVYVDTCPNKDERRPEDCGSFQWK